MKRPIVNGLLSGMLLLAAASLGAQVPEISYDSPRTFLRLPAHIYLGEAAGVAAASNGNIFVYTRTGEVATMGGSRTFTHGGSRLFEFDATGKYLREIGHGVYGFLFAQAVKIDARDNMWIVDRGSNMVIEFNPAGRVLMMLGRKPESVEVGARRATKGAGVPGDNFNQPTDVAWDAAGNIFVADGYGNARIAKFDKHGKFLKSWGSKGTEEGQFEIPHSLAVDAQGNVYVADLGNRRIQVFDNSGAFKRQISGVGAPRAICISGGPHQFLYSSNSNPPDSLDNGEIYKMELDGTVAGKFGRAGKLIKEFGTVNQIACRNPDVLYVAELTNWRVQKITLHPTRAPN
ncbi:MAG: peptidyl-alpha-hydroxyglycine alpha-amidating lyase family protein [Bryobacteraceae bacterium]